MAIDIGRREFLPALGCTAARWSLSARTTSLNFSSEQYDLRHLEYLVALARERHFGRAAAACGVTQPTLSTAICELETELDLLIVERGRRFGGLTAEGERVVEWARRILSDRDALRQEVGSAKQGLAGSLVLGVIPTALATVGLLISPFQRNHPRVRIKVLSLSSIEI